MAAVPDDLPDLLDRLPAEQRALLAALAARGGGPARALELADEAHINRLGAGQRLQSLVDLGIIVQREGDGPRAADHARVYQLTDTGRELLANRNVEPGDGPTIYATVLRDRVQPAAGRARAEIRRTLGRAGEHLENWMASELARAYTSGVNDGFAQGVAAEAAARTQERPPVPEPVLIARCPEHGLHGQRTECYVCAGPVEQIAMIPAEPLGADASGFGGAIAGPRCRSTGAST